MDLTASYNEESNNLNDIKPFPLAAASDKQRTEMTFGDLTVSSSNGTFYGTSSALINKDLSSNGSH